MMNTRPTISYFISMGDSLSDRGTIYNKKLLGFIPMRFFSGLDGTSPDGSFTNGYPWEDHLIASLASEFTIKKMETKMDMDPTDIADVVINHDPKFSFIIHDFYDLKNDLYISYRGKNFLRSYDEGGLTAHNYRFKPSKSLSLFVKRLVLSRLSDKRELLIEYDKKYKLTNKHKDQTLVIEWSGANDLITVNEKPSKHEADLAVEGRINNVVQLIKNNYRHFVLFNLPDLSLTPRYQAKSESEQNNAKKWSLYFNEKLKTACDQLKKSYPNCSFEIFDVNKYFTDAYQHPEKYGFDKNKLHTPYIQSKDFKMLSNGTSPSSGYMFWDELHPTADLHALLATIFSDIYGKKFDFSVPEVDAKNIKTNMHQPIDYRGFFRRSCPDIRLKENIEPSRPKNKI